MKNLNGMTIALLIGSILSLTIVGGCGSARAVTMVAPVDIDNYSAVYVEDVDIASEEKNEKTDEANAQFAQYAREHVVAALQQLDRFETLGEKGTTPDSLVLQTIIRIKYGNRALRYLVSGLVAGAGYIDVTMRLVEPSSHEIKMEVHSNSELAIGIFGGDMNQVIKKNIKRLIDEFFSQLE